MKPIEARRRTSLCLTSANKTTHFDLKGGLTAERAFSNNPTAATATVATMTTYASLIAGPAAALDSTRLRGSPTRLMTRIRTH